MRELRLKYILELVSNIGAKARTDGQALTMAQKGVQDALQATGREAGLVERALLRMGGVAGKSANDQAAYLAKLALRYQDLRKAAEGAGAAMTKASQVGAAVAAGAYATDRITKTPMDYSLRLAHMANTAYSDRDVAGRVAGKRTLNAAVTAALRSGGGTRDDAAEALDSLIASGVVPIDEAIKMLPAIMRSSTASGASAKGLSTIALRAKQAGVKTEQMPELFNMAMVAGQSGGFELRDMEKWLASAIASGRGVGLTGMEGVRRILASMQASVITAGTKDEAGNNVVNLLNKINSEDTAKDFQKQGIDLRKELLTGVAAGGNSLDTFLGLVDRVTAGVRKDPQFAKLSAQLKREGDTGQETDTTTALRELFQGTAISKVVQDRQALMALVAEMNNRDYVRRVMTETRTNTTALGTSFGVIDSEVATSRQRAINEKDFAATEAFDTVAPAFKGAADAATDLSQRFPTLATGVVAATGALTVFTAALGASGLIGMLTGRAGNAGGVVGMAATTTAGAVATALKAPFQAAGKLGAGMRMAGAFGLPLLGAGLEAWNVYSDDALSKSQKLKGYVGAGVGAAGGWSGATAGAAAGTALLPGVGTLVGAIGGGLAGYYGSKGALNWLWGSDPKANLAGAQLPTAAAPAAKVEIGQGRIEVAVRVLDDRVESFSSIAQQPSNLRLNAGNTNPAGYGARP